MDYKLLIQKAVDAKKFAHAPYSNFKVGAALLTADGKIYTGCNIENSSFGLTICAERTAIFKAMSEGERKFSALAIIGDTEDYLPPCGACRQIISDHCGNIDIILINKSLNYKIFSTHDLLPFAFGDANLNNTKN